MGSLQVMRRQPTVALDEAMPPLLPNPGGLYVTGGHTDQHSRRLRVETGYRLLRRPTRDALGGDQGVGHGIVFSTQIKTLVFGAGLLSAWIRKPPE